MKDVVYYVVKRQLDFTPGTGSVYFDYGYLLLSYLVERVTGVSYVDYLRDNILGGLDVRP